ncbi:hypothetical protein KKB55_02955 [Myxococcota bacterium]|nr:hypothetical protein [Myxococcota bacterium]MBU1896711.1 hypothetical protein [Myxococcota bacterium]
MSLARALLFSLFFYLPCADASELGVAARAGAFGLFNLNNQEFISAEPSLGLALDLTRPLTPRLSWGLVVALSWVRSEVGARRHLLVDPALRLRGALPISDALNAEAVLDAGGAFWPMSDAERALHPALSADRWGWSLRLGGGLAYTTQAASPLGELTGFAHLAYAASSSYGGGLDATVDHAVLSLGARRRF